MPTSIIKPFHRQRIEKLAERFLAGDRSCEAALFEALRDFEALRYEYGDLVDEHYTTSSGVTLATRIEITRCGIKRGKEVEASAWLCANGHRCCRSHAALKRALRKALTCGDEVPDVLFQVRIKTRVIKKTM